MIENIKFRIKEVVARWHNEDWFSDSIVYLPQYKRENQKKYHSFRVLWYEVICYTKSEAEKYIEDTKRKFIVWYKWQDWAKWKLSEKYM